MPQFRDPILGFKLKFQESMEKSVEKCKAKHKVSRCNLCGDTLHCHSKKYEEQP